VDEQEGQWQAGLLICPGFGCLGKVPLEWYKNMAVFSPSSASDWPLNEANLLLSNEFSSNK